MMDDPIHIPLIEDDPAHAELIKRAFENRGDRSRLTIPHTLEKARAQIKKFRPSLIIADWRLTDGDSSALLTQNHYSPAPPVIIMTSYGSERNAVDVWDALSSDHPNRKQMPPREVAEYLEKEAGRLFDKEIVEKFLPLIITR